MDSKAANCLIKLLKSNEGTMDYITTRIVLCSSGVLLGCKPGCSITFARNNYPNNLYELWALYKDKIFEGSKLEYYELFNGANHIVVYVFHPSKLAKVLKEAEIIPFLSSLGYEANWNLEDKLLLLKNKFQISIPHEIGIFLGIPLKDVMGFMGINNLKLSCRLGWKIYGDPEPSRKLSLHYDQCRNKIIHMLDNSDDPLEILRNI